MGPRWSHPRLRAMLTFSPPIHHLEGWPSREGSHPNPLKSGSNCKLFHFSNHILSLSAIWRARYMHPLFVAFIWQCRNFLNSAFSDYCFQAGIPITSKGGRTSILQQEILFTVFPKLENYLHLICGVVEDSTKQSNFLLNIIYRFSVQFLTWWDKHDSNLFRDHVSMLRKLKTSKKDLLNIPLFCQHVQSGISTIHTCFCVTDRFKAHLPIVWFAFSICTHTSMERWGFPTHSHSVFVRCWEHSCTAFQKIGRRWFWKHSKTYSLHTHTHTTC